MIQRGLLLHSICHTMAHQNNRHSGSYLPHWSTNLCKFGMQKFGMQKKEIEFSSAHIYVCSISTSTNMFCLFTDINIKHQTCNHQPNDWAPRYMAPRSMKTRTPLPNIFVFEIALAKKEYRNANRDQSYKLGLSCRLKNCIWVLVEPYSFYRHCMELLYCITTIIINYNHMALHGSLQWEVVR